MDRIVPFHILLSPEPLPPALGEAQAQSDASHRFSKLKRVFRWDLNQPLAARFVRVQLERDTYLHFAEVRATSPLAPPRVRWGSGRGPPLTSVAARQLQVFSRVDMRSAAPGTQLASETSTYSAPPPDCRACPGRGWNSSFRRWARLFGTSHGLARLPPSSLPTSPATLAWLGATPGDYVAPPLTLRRAADAPCSHEVHDGLFGVSPLDAMEEEDPEPKVDSRWLTPHHGSELRCGTAAPARAAQHRTQRCWVRGLGSLPSPPLSPVAAFCSAPAQASRPCTCSTGSPSLWPPPSSGSVQRGAKWPFSPQKN